MEVKTDEKLMFPADELARSVWKTKYAQEGETHYDQMHKRMVEKFMEVEDLYRPIEDRADKRNLSETGKNRQPLNKDSLYKLFKDFKYIIPQGSIMAQLGTKEIGSLSNCFIIEAPLDSYSGIMKADEEEAQLMKRRGGVGFDISTLRPENTPTSNAAKSSTGAVSFMHRFSNTCREVAQNGRK